MRSATKPEHAVVGADHQRSRTRADAFQAAMHVVESPESVRFRPSSFFAASTGARCSSCRARARDLGSPGCSRSATVSRLPSASSATLRSSACLRASSWPARLDGVALAGQAVAPRLALGEVVRMGFEPSLGGRIERCVSPNVVRSSLSTSWRAPLRRAAAPASRLRPARPPRARLRHGRDC